MFTVNDFFCGAGGMGLGFKNAGFEIAGAWDFDKYAVQSYKHNVGNHVLQADISKMDFMDLTFADVWTFGFPCQDLSNAGKQAGMIKGKTRSGLFFEIIRLLEEVNENLGPEFMPKVIMAENVKGLKKYLPVLEEEYAKVGYKMYYTLYNSKFWGVPQSRDRYFVIGIHESIGKEFIFPVQQEDLVPKLSSILEVEVDKKYYMSPEKAKVIVGKVKDKLLVKQATIKGYDEATEGDTINISHPNSKTRRGRVGKQIAQTLLTGQEQIIVEKVMVHNIYGGFNEKEPRVFTEYSPTIRTTAGGGHLPSVADLKDVTLRNITPRETARLQGFPDSYKQVVSDNQFKKQMGNAVTVNVAEAIATAIQDFLKDV